MAIRSKLGSISLHCPLGVNTPGILVNSNGTGVVVPSSPRFLPNRLGTYSSCGPPREKFGGPAIPVSLAVPNVLSSP